MIFSPEPLVVTTIFSIAAVILLPRLKGVIVAFQWANYIGGFYNKKNVDYETSEYIPDS